MAARGGFSPQTFTLSSLVPAQAFVRCDGRPAVSCFVEGSGVTRACRWYHQTASRVASSLSDRQRVFSQSRRFCSSASRASLRCSSSALRTRTLSRSQPSREAFLACGSSLASAPPTARRNLPSLRAHSCSPETQPQPSSACSSPSSPSSARSSPSSPSSARSSPSSPSSVRSSPSSPSSVRSSPSSPSSARSSPSSPSSARSSPSSPTSARSSPSSPSSARSSPSSPSSARSPPEAGCRSLPPAALRPYHTFASLPLLHAPSSAPPLWRSPWHFVSETSSKQASRRPLVPSRCAVACAGPRSVPVGEAWCPYSAAATLLLPFAAQTHLRPHRTNARSFASASRARNAWGEESVRDEGRDESESTPDRVRPTPRPRIPTLCLGVSVHRDVVGYALIQPKASWFPLKVGFIDLAGGAHTLPDQAAEVAGVLLALRDQQHRLLSQREEPEETPGWQTSRRDSCRAPEEEGVPSVQLQGRSVGKLEERQKRCFWIVGLEAALRVPQSFREATRAASLQQLKGAVSAELLKIFSVSNVIHVEPKQARTTLARVAGVPLGSRQETLQWLSEQVPSFPSRLRREEAALTMADAWLVAVHAQRTVEAMRLRERLRGFLAAESGRHLFKACGAAHAPSLPAPLPPHLVKLVDTLRVPSGRVEALRQAVAEAADVRTRRELLQVLKSRQESELTQAIARHLDVVYQSARGLFVAPGQSAFPHNGKEGCAVAQSFWEARGSRTADAETAAASAHPHRDGGEATGGQASLSADPVAVQKVRQRARREPRDVRGVERAGGALPHARRNGSTVSQEEAGDNERVGWNVAEPDLRREEPGSPASLGRGRSEREATVAMVASRVAAANAELQASRRNERIHDAGGKSLCPSHHRQGPPTG
uniref:Uncharacterized protein n=1 Tax=Neospora caninum (strain Liverpool) TaxID=572307 RepID=A0A0F7UPK2_NEOCL|nr:TPA: hypothetical protein BN1204_066160 [Neospora caninum Liverpool]